MSHYLVKRLGLVVPTAILATILVFLLMQLAPGDAAVMAILAADDTGEGVFGDRQLLEENIENLRERYGLNDPLPVQYFNWVGSVVSGEFGVSLSQRRPVSDIIKERLPRTAWLTLLVAALTAFWAVPTGVLSAIWQNSAKDQVLRIVSVLGLSVPNIWLGILFLFTFSRYVGWTPPLQWRPMLDDPMHTLSIILAPAIIVSYSVGAPIMRMTRGQMLEVLREDYVRTARSKGLGETSVLVRHALRNALLPVITQFGLLVSSLITGLVVTETVFNIPGLGKSIVDAITLRDYPMLQGLVLLFIGLVMAVNIVIDLMYSVIDPRIRYS